MCRFGLNYWREVVVTCRLTFANRNKKAVVSLEEWKRSRSREKEEKRTRAEGGGEE